MSKRARKAGLGLGFRVLEKKKKKKALDPCRYSKLCFVVICFEFFLQLFDLLRKV